MDRGTPPWRASPDSSPPPASSPARQAPPASTRCGAAPPRVRWRPLRRSASSPRRGWSHSRTAPPRAHDHRGPRSRLPPSRIVPPWPKERHRRPPPPLPPRTSVGGAHLPTSGGAPRCALQEAGAPVGPLRARCSCCASALARSPTDGDAARMDGEPKRRARNSSRQRRKESRRRRV